MYKHENDTNPQDRRTFFYDTKYIHGDNLTDMAKITVHFVDFQEEPEPGSTQVRVCASGLCDQPQARPCDLVPGSQVTRVSGLLQPGAADVRVVPSPPAVAALSPSPWVPLGRWLTDH